MQNNYILKNNDEILMFYYGKERAIYCKKFNSNNFSTTIKVVQDVTDCFSVALDENGYINIFSEQYSGNILLSKMDNLDINTNVLFDKSNELSQNNLFFPIFYKDNISLIYNNTQPNNQNGYLSIKTLVDGKKWTPSENIDLFYPFANNMFYMQKIDKEHYILAYQKKSKDMLLGYKEIKNFTISDFIPIHNTAYQIVDYSFVYFNEEMHYIYVLKNLFSTQVIYKKKTKNGFSNPIMLFEGQKIKSCCISILNDELYCSFILANTLYYCKSEDLGASFQNISKYRKNITQDVVKAKYISNSYDNGINEVYVDCKNELNIYLIPEFLPEFFCYNTPDIKDYSQNTPFNQEENQSFITNLNNQFSQTPVNQNVNNKPSFENNPVFKIEPTIKSNQNYNHNVIPVEQDFMANFNLEQFANFKTNNFSQNTSLKDDISSISNVTEDASFLKNKLSVLNEQLEEKNNQILKLNSIIQNKNTEKVDIEIALRKKVKTQDEDIKNLNDKIKLLQEENNSLTQNLSSLQEKNLSLTKNIQSLEKELKSSQVMSTEKEKTKPSKKDSRKKSNDAQSETV